MANNRPKDSESPRRPDGVDGPPARPIEGSEPTIPVEGGESTQFARLSIDEGTRVDRYVLGPKLGQGGMGAVFAADQMEPVQRRVAFKVIQLGMDTEALLRRFDSERRILAVLDHPNIATMLDAGATPEGRPYFVMEYVDGVEIDTYCKVHRLTISQRIELFLQVLAGIEHAHQRGVIHRDLKPGNIVVSSMEGQPPLAKIIDFGIAKSLGGNVTDDGTLTQCGEVIGTPMYMAPEQVRLDSDSLDVRADIFSLAVVLYELLVGVPPFESQSGISDFRREITTRESRTPRQALRGAKPFIGRLADERRISLRALKRLLSGDIASVVLKALKCERSERYRSVSEFSDDLRRYLDGYPVIAKPRGFWYLAGRLAARRKGLVTATALATLALIGTTLAAVIGFLRADRAAEEAERAASEANLIASFQAAQLSGIDPPALGEFLRTALTDEVREERERRGLEPAEIDAIVQQLESLVAGANFTDLALDSLEASIFVRALAVIDEQYAEQPAVQARLWQSIANTLRSLGRLESATKPQSLALETRRRLFGDDHEDTFQSISSTGILLKEQGDISGAEPHYREALRISRKILGPDHIDTLSAVSNMGVILQMQGKAEEAEPYYLDALESTRRIFGEDHRETLISIGNLGFLLESQGKIDEAEPYYREALERKRRVLGDDDPETLIAISNMGYLLETKGQLREAESLYQEAIQRKRQVQGNEHLSTLISISNMGRLQRKLGDLERAEVLGREATETARSVLGTEHPRLGSFLYAYGGTLMALERFPEAHRALSQSHVILSRPGSGGERYVGRAIQAMVDLYEAWNEHDPGKGYEVEASAWRARLEALSGSDP